MVKHIFMIFFLLLMSITQSIYAAGTHTLSVFHNAYSVSWIQSSLDSTFEWKNDLSLMEKFQPSIAVLSHQRDVKPLGGLSRRTVNSLGSFTADRMKHFNIWSDADDQRSMLNIFHSVLRQKANEIRTQDFNVTDGFAHDYILLIIGIIGYIVIRRRTSILKEGLEGDGVYEIDYKAQNIDNPIGSRHRLPIRTSVMKKLIMRTS